MTEKENLGVIAVVVALFIAGITLFQQGWTIVFPEKTTQVGQYTLIVGAVLMVTAAIIIIAEVRRKKQPNLQQKDLVKELLNISLDKTDFTIKDGDLLKSADKVAEAYKIIRNKINT